MRRSDTISGIIDKLELCEAELQAEIKQMKDANLIFSSLSNALDRRDLALRSLKRIVI